MPYTSTQFSDIADNYTKVHTDAGVAIFEAQWSSTFNGSKIIEIEGLRMLHIPKTKHASISNDELKEKLFTCVYNSKNKTNEKMKDCIYEKMKELFPGANSLVLIKSKDSRSTWCIKGHKAFAHFEGYGDYDVITCFF